MDTFTHPDPGDDPDETTAELLADYLDLVDEYVDLKCADPGYMAQRWAECTGLPAETYHQRSLPDTR